MWCFHDFSGIGVLFFSVFLWFLHFFFNIVITSAHIVFLVTLISTHCCRICCCYCLVYQIIIYFDEVLRMTIKSVISTTTGWTSCRVLPSAMSMLTIESSNSPHKVYTHIVNICRMRSPIAANMFITAVVCINQGGYPKCTNCSTSSGLFSSLRIPVMRNMLDIVMSMTARCSGFISQV